MPSAELIAVLGVISTVVDIVDRTKQLYDAASNVQGLPGVFREVSNRLPIVGNILNLVEEAIQPKDGDRSHKEVKDVVGACGEKAKKLETIFRKVIPAEKSSRTRRYYSAVKTLGKGNQVELLMKGMLEDIQLLTSNHALRAMTTTQAEEILKAISELSAIQSSVPEYVFQETGFNANNFGSGTQSNFYGQVEYNAQGNARQLNSAGGAMHFETVYNNDKQNNSNLNSDEVVRTKCLAALFLTDPIDDRRSMMYLKGSRAEGTCQWIATNELYQSWLLSSQSQVLWLSGGPGKGKTMLSIFLAEEIEKTTTLPQWVLLQYFCDNKDAKRSMVVAIVRGLIYQLLKAVPNLDRHILPDFKIQKESLFSADSFESLWRIFTAMICDPVLRITYCILDGIDECAV